MWPISRVLAVTLLLSGCGRDAPLTPPGAGSGADGGADASFDATAGEAGVSDAGPICRSAFDCFEGLGPPPPCPGGRPGRWVCPFGRCENSCDAASECTLDCDCPFERACILGRCVTAGRFNFCCSSPYCRPGEQCVRPGGFLDICPARDGGILPDGSLAPDGGEGPDGGLPDVGGPGGVGAPCAVSFDCASRTCLEATAGFPGGYCSQPCGNAQGSCPAGASCREVGSAESLCLDDCVTTAECRAGYRCVQLGATPGRVCWPIDPGSGNPFGAPIGSACQIDNDCAQASQCLQGGWPGGYCTIPFCDAVSNPCPPGSSCFAFPGSSSLCLSNCPNGGSSSTCRVDYFCFGLSGQPGGCIPN